MQTYQFATSRLGLPILAHTFGGQGPHILILGGVHGNEPEGVVAALGLLQAFREKFPYQIKLTLIPSFNIDGVISKTRGNSAGIDLNRNLPTKDWSPVAHKPEYFPGLSANSEPENQALTEWIGKNKPSFIWSLHSWKPMLNVNGNCQPEAGIVSQMTGYILQEDIGYPTPGCLGSYTGLERGIPTITYEIERGLAFDKILAIHVPAILSALRASESRIS